MPTFGLAIRAIAARQGARVFRSATRDVQAAATSAAVQVNSLNVATNRLGGSFGLIARSAAGFLGSIAALAGIRSTVKNIADFEEAITRARVRMRLTTEEFRFFREGIRAIAVETRFTAVEVASGFEQLAQAGIRGARALDVLKDSLDLAAVGVLGAKDATDIVLKTLSQFRLGLDQTTRIVDVFTTVSDNLNATVGQLGEGLKKVAPVALSLGIELETIVPVMGLLIAEMGSASRAGTGLRSTMGQITKFSKATKDVLKSLGLTVDDFDIKARGLVPVLRTVSENFEGFKEKLKLVGLEAIIPLTILDKLGGRIEELNKQAKENIGITKDMAAAFENNLGGAFRRLISAVTDLQLEVGDQGLLGILRKTVDFTRDVVQALKGVEDGFITSKKAVLAFTEGLRIFGAVLASLVTFKILSGLAGIAIVLNPITAVIAAAVGALVFFRNETVGVGQVTTTVGNLVLAIWKSITDIIEASFGVLSNSIKSVFILVKDIARDVGNLVTLNFSKISTQFSEEFLSALDKVTNASAKMTRVFNTLPKVFTANLIKMNDELDKLRKPPPEIVTPVLLGTDELATNTKNVVKVTKELTDQQRSAIRFADDLGTAMTDAFGDIIRGAETAGQAIRNLIDKLAELILQQVLLQPLANAISFGLISTLGGTAAFAPVSLNPATVFTGGPALSRFGPGSGGGTRNFQKGGIISGPTFFRDGLAGEAGPEAILPLKRGPDGDLGVSLAGGSSVVVNMNIQTPNADSFRKSNRQIINATRRLAARLS